MSTVETVRLNREDFVRWLAKALSASPTQPTRGRVSQEKATDVTLAWTREAPDSWPAVCVPEVQIPDLLAFVSTYTKARPFSAYFRVLPLELVSVLEPRRHIQSKSSNLAKCVAGAAMAEAWVVSAREADRPRNVFSLLLSSLSATLGRVVLAGYDEAALDWALRQWVELRTSPDDILRRQDVKATSAPWRLLSSEAESSSRRFPVEGNLIANFVSMALVGGTVQPEMLRRLAPLSEPVDLPALLSSSREERITRFNKFVSDLKLHGQRSAVAAFLAGLMLAIAGNGSFELLRSARQFDGWLDGAVAWFGFCAALFEESNILSYADSAGRRLVRDVSQFDDPFAPPRADIASTEFQFLSHQRALSQIVTHAPGFFDIEILPNVVTRVTGAALEEDDRRLDETDMLLQNLNEAGYLIDQARRIAMGADRNDRQGSLLKPPRRTRSR